MRGFFFFLFDLDISGLVIYFNVSYMRAVFNKPKLSIQKDHNSIYRSQQPFSALFVLAEIEDLN